MLLFSLLFYSNTSSAFFSAASDITDRAISAELVIDSIQELSETVYDDADLYAQLNSVQAQSKEIRETIRYVGNTSDELEALLKEDDYFVRDMASTISRVANRIKKGKALVKKAGVLSKGGVEAVTATEVMKTNNILQEMNLKEVSKDLEKHREKQRLSLIKIRKDADKKKFFDEQFELMSKKRTGSLTYSPFSFSKSQVEE